MTVAGLPKKTLISIHTLCEEGDGALEILTSSECPISIHTLCEEGDQVFVMVVWWERYFNPHPLWRGWRIISDFFIHAFGISIHTLCEEGDYLTNMFLKNNYISIHTLCEEGDIKILNICLGFDTISIHTLCEEGDKTNMFQKNANSQFQSTPSVKRVTSYTRQNYTADYYFNPHPLWRGWLNYCVNDVIILQISIHTLCEEGDCQNTLWHAVRVNFNPHPLWRGWH